MTEHEVNSSMVSDRLVQEILDNVQDGDTILVLNRYQQALFEMRAAGRGVTVTIELHPMLRGTPRA